MLRGVLIAESLRVDAEVAVDGLICRSIARHDGQGKVSASQPRLWTVIDFEAPIEVANVLSSTLAAALMEEGGWYADFVVENDRVIVFANRVFRYKRGDASGREAARAYGRSMGVPEHQLDWSN